MKLFTQAVFIILFSLFSRCSPPKWIHEFPDDPLINELSAGRLNGVWERPVSSPYSAADPESRIAAEETIEISENHYKKNHLYREHVHGMELTEVYMESGKLQSSGPWILFIPENAFHYKSEQKIIPPAPALKTPDPLGQKLRQIKPPGPLLYYLKPADTTLTPLAMERMGRIYESGIYEGSTLPHDSESESFQHAVYVYNYKRFYKHGYRKRR